MELIMWMRTANGPDTVTIFRHTAISIVKGIPDKASLKARRKTLKWDDDCLLVAGTGHCV